MKNCIFKKVILVTTAMLYAVNIFSVSAMASGGEAAALSMENEVSTETKNRLNKKIAGGWDHTAAIKADGTVLAWGDNYKGQCNVPQGLNDVVSISAGIYYTVALKSNGTVVVWGNNEYGQCNVPEGLSGVVSVSAGDKYIVALKGDGTVVAWGSNEKGQCNIPEGLNDIVSIDAGLRHVVALKSDGKVVAWGNNERDQCNIPEGLSGVVTVSAGEFHSVALKEDGTVVVWGFDNAGQFNVPEGLNGVVSVSAGLLYTLALKDDGTVVAWGNNGFKQCVIPKELKDVVSIDAGSLHAVALKEDGTVTAWGYNVCEQCDIPHELINIKNTPLLIAESNYHASVCMGPDISSYLSPEKMCITANIMLPFSTDIVKEITATKSTPGISVDKFERIEGKNELNVYFSFKTPYPHGTGAISYATENLNICATIIKNDGETIDTNNLDISINYAHYDAGINLDNRVYDITDNSATLCAELHGDVSHYNGNPVAVYWKKGQPDNAKEVKGTFIKTGTVIANIEDLKPETEYEFLWRTSHNFYSSSFKTLAISTPTIIYGDVNGDNIINSADYTLLRSYLLRKKDTLPNINAADLNIDGVIDTADYTVLRKYLLRIIDVLPYNK